MQTATAKLATHFHELLTTTPQSLMLQTSMAFLNHSATQ